MKGACKGQLDQLDQRATQGGKESQGLLVNREKGGIKG